MIREYESAIFVGYMTKIGKISRKKPINTVIFFDVNILKEKGVGIKLAIEYKRHNTFCIFLIPCRENERKRITQARKNHKDI